METEKKPTSEALKRAKKKYYEKMKLNEDFMNKNKEAVKEWQNKHKNEESYKQMTRKIVKSIMKITVKKYWKECEITTQIKKRTVT